MPAVSMPRALTCAGRVVAAPALSTATRAVPRTRRVRVRVVSLMLLRVGGEEWEADEYRSLSTVFQGSPQVPSTVYSTMSHGGAEEPGSATALGGGDPREERGPLQGSIERPRVPGFGGQVATTASSGASLGKVIGSWRRGSM